MEKTFEAIQFIIDLFKFAENLKRKQKYELDYYSIQGRFKFYHPGAILEHIIVDKELDDFEQINKDAYYIFYNILKQNCVYLEGSEVEKLKYWSPDNLLLNALENNQTLNHILYWSFITDKIEDLIKIANKIQKLSFTEFSTILNNYYTLFNKILKTKSDTDLLLFDSTVEVEDIVDARYYTNNRLRSLLSLYLYLEYDYYNACEDGNFLNECKIKNFIEYIFKRFSSYKHLRNSIYFNVYPSFIANADGGQCCASIYIDFEIDDPLKLLLSIEALGIIDKI